MYPKIVRKTVNGIVKQIDKAANYQWYHYPFGKKPLADKTTYLQIAKKAKEKRYEQVDIYEQSTSYAIDKSWLDKLALHTQVVKKKSVICYQHGRLLYSTLRKYIEESKVACVNIIETGTARGFSAMCMSKALSDARTGGKIVTFDVLPHNVKMFWNCIDDLEGEKTREELLYNYSAFLDNYVIFHQGDTQIELPKVQLSRVHFAFLDGTHHYNDVLIEFDAIKYKQKRGDIIFFDDYTPSIFPGVVKAVDEICDKYAYTKQVIQIDSNRGYVIAKKV